MFSLSKSIAILERTPSVLNAYLNELPDSWLKTNEGSNTWSPYDVIGHLIHGEKTDWMVRLQLILSDASNKTFEPFDRFAQQHNDQNQSISQLLKEFEKLRHTNLSVLRALNLSDKDLNKTGIHPELGKVTLQQLIASWVVHDLGHIAQISRVMAKQYTEDVGPWKAYLGILNR